MYEIFRTTSFKKDYKRLSNKEKELLKPIVKTLAEGKKLDDELKDYKLIGNYLGCCECHIQPDLSSW